MTTSTDSTGKGLLLKAEVIADTFRDEIVQVLQSRPRPPKLVGILATSAAPSRFYAEFTKKQCDGLGFVFVLKEIGAALNPENGEGDGVEEAIMEANEDDTVDGIMVSVFRSCFFVFLFSRVLNACCVGLLPYLW
jgi:methylenetetrahydrofolate dehydrogenase (NAD+)